MAKIWFQLLNRTSMAGNTTPAHPDSRPAVWRSGNCEIQKSGNREIQESGNREIQKSENRKIQKSGICPLWIEIKKTGF